MPPQDQTSTIALALYAIVQTLAIIVLVVRSILKDREHRRHISEIEARATAVERENKSKADLTTTQTMQNVQEHLTETQAMGIGVSNKLADIVITQEKRLDLLSDDTASIKVTGSDNAERLKDIRLQTLSIDNRLDSFAKDSFDFQTKYMESNAKRQAEILAQGRLILEQLEQLPAAIQHELHAEFNSILDRIGVIHPTIVEVRQTGTLADPNEPTVTVREQ